MQRGMGKIVYMYVYLWSTFCEDGNPSLRRWGEWIISHHCSLEVEEMTTEVMNAYSP